MRGFPFSARAVALAATFLAGSAYAATPEEADKGAGAPAQAAPAAGQDDGEIIVTTTAQKRFENIQNVPLAVQVVTPADLEAQGVRHFQDLGKVSPSLVIRPSENPVNANVSLRGIGTFAYAIGVESSVAVTVDGVPLAFQARAFSDLPDVAMIEVLRGPQSTLYGKAASAGLIKIMTVQPTKDFHVKANVLATDDREYGGNFSVTGPINDNLGYVVSASYSNWDGNVLNVFNNKRVNGRETLNTRAKLKWKATPDVIFTLSGNYVDGKTDFGRPFIRVTPGATFLNTPGLTTDVVLPGITIEPDNQKIANNDRAGTKFAGGGGILRTDINIGKMQVLGLTSYDKFHMNDYIDQDDTVAPGAIGRNIQDGRFQSRLFTQEIRLLSPGEDAFRYALGVYYADAGFQRRFYRGPVTSPQNWFATSGSRQIAAFGQIDWEFIQHLTATVGGRAQNERVEYTFDDRRLATSYGGHASDDATTYRLGLNWQATREILAFGSYATGYKGQTYDLTSNFDKNRAAAGPIRPETSKDWEFGVRSQFFGRRVTFNVTYFSTDYTDLQAQTIEQLADGTSNFRLTNVGKMNTKGLEFEAAARVMRDLTINGGLTYLDATYLSFPAAPCYTQQGPAQGCVTQGKVSYQVLTGTRAIQAPEWKGSMAIDYSPALTEKLNGVLVGSWQYQSSVYYAARDPETFQPAFSIFNLTAGVRDHKRRWEATLFVNNLFDKQYFPALVNSGGNFGKQIATQSVLPRDFRRYAGLRFGVNY
ncbi:TonB-dependent receptor [Sphingomonas sp. ABOLD]|uniref:Iron complex outermembrane receptor protein n=1 Tax=Sphingomonas trueperi TaxID=53317 RepID=A0A7X6BBT6_9SPHN|nr:MULTISPECIES: TonB-dependent receptor [Sphingomonas]NJB96858.1 iron complex outermembrane receptor protein [Sphingomonas trueperi]RSV51868.1 TonB-dependent receptor [Sphingomonas sp. ABOLD]